MKKLIKSKKENYQYIKRKKSWCFLSGTITLIISALFMFLTVSTVLVKVVPHNSFINIVSGESMDPTLHDGQFMFASDEAVKRGDIVVSRFPQKLIEERPEEKSTTIIKRVIGLPGETVDIQKDGTVLINNVELDESYLTEEHKKSTYLEGKNNHVDLNSAQYFIMGDNRDNSYDSRYFGAVNIGDIRGVQSTGPTSQTWIKSIYVILYLCLILLAYELIDFAVVKVFYKIISKNKSGL
nr:signal peptidase I [uncultured Ruminococcus sp.]